MKTLLFVTVLAVVSTAIGVVLLGRNGWMLSSPMTSAAFLWLMCQDEDDYETDDLEA